VHTCNPCTQEAEAGGLRVQRQSGLHCQALSKKGGLEVWLLALQEQSPEFKHQ
jgi:hypothetical protein